MSLASEIIQKGYDAIGLGSELLATDQTLLDEGLETLRSLMEELRKNGIILEETVSGTTTTIALPTLASDELDEPTAARRHLINALAVHLIPDGRPPAEGLKIPRLDFSIGALRDMYLVHTIPAVTPSQLLPRGQGAGTSQSTFFRGGDLDEDAT